MLTLMTQTKRIHSHRFSSVLYMRVFSNKYSWTNAFGSEGNTKYLMMHYIAFKNYFWWTFKGGFVITFYSNIFWVVYWFNLHLILLKYLRCKSFTTLKTYKWMALYNLNQILYSLLSKGQILISNSFACTKPLTRFAHFPNWKN